MQAALSELVANWDATTTTSDREEFRAWLCDQVARKPTIQCNIKYMILKRKHEAKLAELDVAEIDARAAYAQHPNHAALERSMQTVKLLRIAIQKIENNPLALQSKVAKLADEELKMRALLDTTPEFHAIARAEETNAAFRASVGLTHAKLEMRAANRAAGEKSHTSGHGLEARSVPLVCDYIVPIVAKKGQNVVILQSCTSFTNVAAEFDMMVVEEREGRPVLVHAIVECKQRIDDVGVSFDKFQKTTIDRLRRVEEEGSFADKSGKRWQFDASSFALCDDRMWYIVRTPLAGKMRFGGDSATLNKFRASISEWPETMSDQKLDEMRAKLHGAGARTLEVLKLYLSKCPHQFVLVEEEDNERVRCIE